MVSYKYFWVFIFFLKSPTALDTSEFYLYSLVIFLLLYIFIEIELLSFVILLYFITIFGLLLELEHHRIYIVLLKILS